jgi:hypothetical protein
MGGNVFDVPLYQPPSSSSKPQEPFEADKIHPPFSPRSQFRKPPSKSFPQEEEGKSSSSSSGEKQNMKKKNSADENNNSSECKSTSDNKTGNTGCKDNNNKYNCNRNSSTSSTNKKGSSNDSTPTTGRGHHNGGGNRVPPPSSSPSSSCSSANGGSGRSDDNSGECGCGKDDEINKEKKCHNDATTHQVEESFSCPWFLQVLFYIIILSLLIWACLYALNALLVCVIMSMSQKMETKHNHDSKETSKPDSSSYVNTSNKSDDKSKTKSNNKEPRNNNDKTFMKSKKSSKKFSKKSSKKFSKKSSKKSSKKKMTLPPAALKHYLGVFEMLDENGMINTADDLSLKALEKVHKKLRRKFHPDKNIGNEDIATKKFHRVDEAWHQIIKALGGKN